jgi:dipeptidyl-peptidase-4
MIGPRRAHILRTLLVSASLVLPTDPAELEGSDDALLTVPESTEYRGTASYDQVRSFCDALAVESPRVRFEVLGRSGEGREIPLLVVTESPLGSLSELGTTGKPIALLLGGIHAGESCGKDALLGFARDLARAEASPILREWSVAFVPILNPDGNENRAPEHRTGQNGPEGPKGARGNSQGLDLNRDWIKLEAPETRAVLGFIRRHDPLLIIDTHTTNGSFHRYGMTYAGPKHPSGDRAIIELVRDRFLPELGKRLLATSGVESFFYGDFEADHTRWTTFPDQPRFGTTYFGLRQRLGVLSEAYAYDTYRERVINTRAFVEIGLGLAAEERAAIEREIRDADQRAVEWGTNPSAAPPIVLRSRAVPLAEKRNVLGYVETIIDGKTVALDEPRDYEAELWLDYAPVHSVGRPFAYLVPPSLARVVGRLEDHGVVIDELREDLDLDVEAYTIRDVRFAEERFQGHHLATVSVESSSVIRRVPAGTLVVRTAQKLGSLAAYLLEPEAEDGLCAWNFLDGQLAVGADYPVLRVPGPVALFLSRKRPADELPKSSNPIDFDLVHRRRAGPRTSATFSARWLPDGESYRETRDGREWRVDAASGRRQELFDAAEVTRRLAKVSVIGDELARVRIASRAYTLTPRADALLLEIERDLYHVGLAPESGPARRLTSTPEPEELAETSPDGAFVGFVRANDLWMVDVATSTERALTTGGTDLVRSGKASWVYFEELYDRNWKTWWWSPDSGSIAFLRLDSTQVPRFTIVDDAQTEQRVEVDAYPRPGEPNPLVEIGIVAVRGGDVRWVDLSMYDRSDLLISGLVWGPEGRELVYFAQDRVQSWLDVWSVSRQGGKPRRLLRQTTQAWVEAPFGPLFLRDGSFVISSEESGWKHLYRHAMDGTRIATLTQGDWEVRRVHEIDDAEQRIFISGTRDSHRQEHLYSVALDGSGVDRVSELGFHHGVQMAPGGRFAILRSSNHATPDVIRLHDSRGAVVRVLDSNPAREISDYQWGSVELFTLKLSDAVELPALFVKPAGFDAAKRYPVWFMTYGGPHAPVVRDEWQGGRLSDQVIASEGILVFRCDPRSASGHGARSAWLEHRQLGRAAFEDIRRALEWLREQPFVDPDRIGMSGHSFGGYITAYTMTHSELLAAGIAGAPVTDWRDYDSIYTERFLGTPQENPDGYERTSVVGAAGDLHGRLLIIHGQIDDNVHLQNTTRLIQALQRAGKTFELMLYPAARHGIFGDHYQAQIHGFIRRTVGVER